MRLAGRETQLQCDGWAPHRVGGGGRLYSGNAAPGDVRRWRRHRLAGSAKSRPETEVGAGGGGGG